MIDNEKRIEAAALALFNASIYQGYNDETKRSEWQRMAEIHRSQARAALAAADAVTAESHWLAPNEVTVGMFGDLTTKFKDTERGHLFIAQWALGSFAEDWRRMRDAYLASPVESQDRKAS